MACKFDELITEIQKNKYTIKNIIHDDNFTFNTLVDSNVIMKNKLDFLINNDNEDNTKIIKDIEKKVNKIDEIFCKEKEIKENKNKDLVNNFYKDIGDFKVYKFQNRISDHFVDALLNNILNIEVSNISKEQYGDLYHKLIEKLHYATIENGLHNEYRGKKSKIENALCEKKVLDDTTREILCSYLNINIMVLTDKNFVVYPQFKKYDRGLIFYKFGDSYYPYMNNDVFFTYEKINQIKDMYPKSNITSLKPISKYSLIELQGMANEMDISIKKQGKAGYVNKLKKEIYDDIAKELM